LIPHEKFIDLEVNIIHKKIRLNYINSNPEKSQGKQRYFKKYFLSRPFLKIANIISENPSKQKGQINQMTTIRTFCTIKSLCDFGYSKREAYNIMNEMKLDYRADGYLQTTNNHKIPMDYAERWANKRLGTSLSTMKGAN